MSIERLKMALGEFLRGMAPVVDEKTVRVVLDVFDQQLQNVSQGLWLPFFARFFVHRMDRRCVICAADLSQRALEKNYVKSSGARVRTTVLGFPPQLTFQGRFDGHGNMTTEQQAAYVNTRRNGIEGRIGHDYRMSLCFSCAMKFTIMVKLEEEETR